MSVSVMRAKFLQLGKKLKPRAASRSVRTLELLGFHGVQLVQYKSVRWPLPEGAWQSASSRYGTMKLHTVSDTSHF